MANRWWVYQRERFPLLAHGPLVAAFGVSAVSYSALLRDASPFPAAGAHLVAFVSLLLFFLQLRIADEFKDFAEDARCRPYRPVPRGLVRLGELETIAAAAAAVQLALSLWLGPALCLPLLAVWLYMALMRREFFAPDWLKARPAVYLGTHALIVPLMGLYATACDWLAADVAPPAGLTWFLLVCLFNGIVFEIGRKIRAPRDEEPGVGTYSCLWGRRNAVLAWLGALSLCAVCAWQAMSRIGFAVPATATVLSLLLAGAALTGWRFLRRPLTDQARLFEPISGLWILFLYLSLAAAALFLRRGEGGIG